MKKLLIMILIVCFVAAGGFVVFSACSDSHVHHLEYHAAKAPSCTEKGHKEYWQCTECGGFFEDGDGQKTVTSEGLTIFALGHDWSEWTEDTAATCAKEGSRYRLCTSCGEVQREVIPAAGHQYDQTTHICSVCGDIQATQDLTFEFAYPAVYPGGSYVLTSTGESTGEIVLPAVYNGKPVTGIAAGGVLSGVTSVQLPQTSIFYIYGGALADTVTQVRYPGDINGWAQLYFESGWAKGQYELFTLSGGAFVKAQDVSLTCDYIAAYAFENNGGLDAIILEGVQRVEQFAFASSSTVSLKAGNISALGYGAFAGCVHLKSADLSSSGITLLNAMTFAGCGLDRLKLPAALKSVAASAVPVRPDSLTFAGSREQWALVEIGADNALKNVICEVSA